MLLHLFLDLIEVSIRSFKLIPLINSVITTDSATVFTWVDFNGGYQPKNEGYIHNQRVRKSPVETGPKKRSSGLLPNNSHLIKEASRQRFFFSPLTLTLVTIELNPESILNRSGATWNTVSCNLPINIFLFSGFLKTSI